ncbi:Alpha-N-acetylgalactosaminidase [Holothuria leucospilota]|uniref:Alpha-galactosidase n=1 Tax=Holothuria leucospilota TaxID=206669 RepID=A0A9Q1BK29_HOLLE|nr:Alpha-N-acetylgalactosaminidase [Holothuria leucospilota]
MHSLFVLTLACYTVSPVLSLQNGLARTPPMGWLSWERFRCNTDCKNHPKTCISENLYKDMADRLAEDGYKDVGYEYVNIDDCWSNKTRDADGNLNPDANRFPSGMKALADYIHKKGLKLGIYADYGTKTCAGFPGSLDYLEKDANRFAEWGIDMLKMDGCNADVSTMKKGYPMMTKYLNATGRPILFSCSWPDYERAKGIPVNYSMVAENCNIWRNYVDIQDSWSSVTKIIDYEASIQDTLVPVVGPGNFNDPDMLIVGDFSLSVSQAQAQMALWAVMAAPLLMSNDLRDITPEFREILLNKEVIAVNQDPQGIMGKRVLQITNTTEAWMRPLQQHWAVCFLNRDPKASFNVSVPLEKLDLPTKEVEGFDALDLYSGKYYGYMPPDATFNCTVAPNGVTFLRFGMAE